MTAAASRSCSGEPPSRGSPSGGVSSGVGDRRSVGSAGRVPQHVAAVLVLLDPLVAHAVADVPVRRARAALAVAARERAARRARQTAEAARAIDRRRPARGSGLLGGGRGAARGENAADDERKGGKANHAEREHRTCHRERTEERDRRGRSPHGAEVVAMRVRPSRRRTGGCSTPRCCPRSRPSTRRRRPRRRPNRSGEGRSGSPGA
jgi:hypothetical protein